MSSKTKINEQVYGGGVRTCCWVLELEKNCYSVAQQLRTVGKSFEIDCIMVNFIFCTPELKFRIREAQLSAIAAVELLS